MSGRSARTRARLLLGAALVLAVGLGGALYGTAGGSGNNPACAAAAATTARLAPLATGEVAALTVAAEPKPLPPLTFRAPDGAERRLADFSGRTVLLNLWATWCLPCRQEMPALDRLQAEMGGPQFEVVAVNIDTRNLDRWKSWLKEAGITRLAAYSDPEAKIFQDLRRAGKAVGMPTTLLIDPSGCELGLMSGPAEWASQDALRLIRAALGRDA